MCWNNQLRKWSFMRPVLPEQEYRFIPRPGKHSSSHFHRRNSFPWSIALFQLVASASAVSLDPESGCRQFVNRDVNKTLSSITATTRILFTTT